MNRRLGWMRWCWEICLPRFKGSRSVKVVEHISLFFHRKCYISYTRVIMLRLVMQNKCPANEFCIKLDDKTNIIHNFVPALHRAWAAHMMVCVMALFPHIWNQSNTTSEVQNWIHYRLPKERIRGALCLQYQSFQGSFFKGNDKRRERRAGVKTTPKDTLKAFQSSACN